jgi:hypothetical protein
MLRKAQSMLYKPEYKATPYFSMRKPGKGLFGKLNMSFISEGRKQKEVKTILLRNNKLKS